ncbi:hypothetical protein DERF_014256 [Dermatophagoides farinae]|uniref:Uncharacterized protein n=1 Tax=Dermatophagoides farinae TaxID=6954 RepID=A0A922KYU1_DERFA|nr:hypothetical protein DERF_014256 [Dermatophagoides farinae]
MLIPPLNKPYIFSTKDFCFGSILDRDQIVITNISRKILDRDNLPVTIVVFSTAFGRSSIITKIFGLRLGRNIGYDCGFHVLDVAKLLRIFELRHRDQICGYENIEIDRGNCIAKFWKFGFGIASPALNFGILKSWITITFW